MYIVPVNLTNQLHVIKSLQSEIAESTWLKITSVSIVRVLSIELLSAKVVRRVNGRMENRRIEIMLGLVTKMIQIYEIHVKSLENEFALDVTISKVNQKSLLNLENPKYEQLIAKYSHLQAVEMIDKDQKEMLPVHLVLGTNEYA